MPICPHCGKAFQEHIDYATEEEQDQIYHTGQQAKRLKYYSKIFVLFMIVSIVLILSDSIIFTNVTPFIRGFRFGGNIACLVFVSIGWYYSIKERKRVFPILKKVGYEL